jgi:hypothetical protein
MPGKYQEPPHGNLPARGVSILKKTYEYNRSKHPEWTKERCAREAWHVVEAHGFIKAECGKWIDTHSARYKNMFKVERREHPEMSVNTIHRICRDHYCKR